jgi:heme/copper-type cytochrome/quinol oxidase subunit 2
VGKTGSQGPDLNRHRKKGTNTMRFDWVNILATVIFVSIVVTLILAVASYFAYKVREARRPKTASELREDGKVKVFFNEYTPK